jgi:quercetin dioxygenase-like cupin family protein
MRRLAFAAALLIAPTAAHADSYPAFPILSAQTNVVGETITYPTTGPAKVTAAIVTMAPGEKTIMHRHGVPMFAYILEGEITVDYGSHGKKTYRAGQGLMEAMAVPHFGTNTGSGPLRLIAVYMGAEGAKNVLAE